MGLMREIYVAESDKQARADGEYHWKNFWERRGGARTYGAHGTTGLTTILDGSRRQQLMDPGQRTDLRRAIKINEEVSAKDEIIRHVSNEERGADQIVPVKPHAGAHAWIQRVADRFVALSPHRWRCGPLPLPW